MKNLILVDKTVRVPDICLLRTQRDTGSIKQCWSEIFSRKNIGNGWTLCTSLYHCVLKICWKMFKLICAWRTQISNMQAARDTTEQQISGKINTSGVWQSQRCFSARCTTAESGTEGTENIVAEPTIIYLNQQTFRTIGRVYIVADTYAWKSVTNWSNNVSIFLHWHTFSRALFVDMVVLATGGGSCWTRLYFSQMVWRERVRKSEYERKTLNTDTENGKMINVLQ